MYALREWEKGEWRAEAGASADDALNEAMRGELKGELDDRGASQDVQVDQESVQWTGGGVR